MVKMSLKEVAGILGKSLNREGEVCNFQVDSRLCSEGSLYFALEGAKNNGHDFLREVSLKGGVGAVVKGSYQGEDFGLELIKVDDPLLALQNLSKKVLDRYNPLVIGITGSIGKTTVKEFTYALLAGSFAAYRTPASCNGQIGLPLTLLNAPLEDVELLVLEMGMSHKGEMDKLVSIARPHLAILTRVAHAHAASFDSVEEIAYEKMKIFNSDRLEKAFIHMQSCKYKAVETFLKNSPIIYAGEENSSFHMPFQEKALIENLQAAIAVARYLKLSDELIQERIYALKPFHHRLQKCHLKKYEHTILIDDTYNNNPISLKTTLQNLEKPKGKGKRIAVIGEMKELGKYSKLAHEEIGVVALPIIDTLFCYGEETKPLHQFFQERDRKSTHYQNKEELLKALLSAINEGDVVLVKGANSNKMWEIVEGLKENIGFF